MRISFAIALLLIAAGCQRSGTAPPKVIAAPAAPAAVSTPMPATVPPPKASGHAKNKASTPVLAGVLSMPNKNKSGASIRESAGDYTDPCIGLSDAAWDDCVARNEREPNDANDNHDPLNRPEFDTRDRELIMAEDAASRDREMRSRDGEPEDQSSDYSDDDSPPEDEPPPEDDPQDDDYDPPPPEDPYN